MDCVHAGLKCSRNSFADSHPQNALPCLLVLHVQVSQHANCSISIEVLQETSSGEHKFKVRIGGSNCLASNILNKQLLTIKKGGRSHR